MNYRHHSAEETDAIVQLFQRVFTQSEGSSEGVLISRLAQDLFTTTAGTDLFNYVADDGGQIVGSIFFSRISFGGPHNAFLLSPVAVDSSRQGEGTGQSLINYGLNDLQQRGAQIVLTYGDPAFYQKVGFQQISHRSVEAPFRLSQPEGWLGQSLDDNPIDALSGRCTCVPAFDDAVYW